MKKFEHFCFLLILILSFSQSWADDKLITHKITENVYAIVGDLGNRSSENLGNNATFGFVVTLEGVVLIDSGGTFQGAQNIDRLIKEVTDKPVITVINTGGQDHRWLGNDYFKQQGAAIIASEEAVIDQKERSEDQLIMLTNLLGEESIKSTNLVYADKTFVDNFEFELGGIKFEVYYSGQAHTPGDSYVWLPQQKVMFTGDIVYVERMLGIGAQSNSKNWINAFEAMAEFKPLYLVPGHGKPTDLAHATKDTYDYLMFLRQSVTDFMDDGNDISDIGNVDQSTFEYLDNFEMLAGRNAQQVFIEMEWE